MSRTKGTRRSSGGDRVDVEALIAEIGRYLAVVAVFRAEGCEPRWATVLR